MNNFQGEGNGDCVIECRGEDEGREKEGKLPCWNWNMKVYNCGIF